MADQFATPAELASALQIDIGGLNTAAANLALNASTAVVQGAVGGQRLVEVLADPFEMLGTTESVLWLPQRPVTAVISVTLDGDTLTAGTDYKVMGRSRLKRLGGYGWQASLYEPSTVAGVTDHGYAVGVQELELAKSTCLSLAIIAYDNPGGATSEAIDDYRVMYERAASALEESPYLRRALMRQYGRMAGLVRTGGS